jgi:hypothetical protein
MTNVLQPVPSPTGQAAQLIPAASPQPQKNQRKGVITSSILRLSATVKVNIPIINQIAKMTMLFIRISFLLSSLFAQL